MTESYFPKTQCQEFTFKKRSEVEVAVNVFYDKAVTDVAHAKPIASLCTVSILFLSCYLILFVVLYMLLDYP